MAKKHLFSRVFNPFYRENVTDEDLILRFENYLRKNIKINEEQIKNMSRYFVFNILEISNVKQEVINDELQGTSIEVVDNKKRGYTGMLQNMSNNLFDILNVVPNPNDSLEEIKDVYANVVGQLEGLSIEPGRDANVIEEQIKTINRSINRHRQEYYSEDGYRNTNVGFRGKDAGLLKKEHVSKAMQLYSESIAKLLEEKDNLDDEKYIKEVAKLHYRFIQIHPFPDGNGRTARAISNMLLLEKNMSATFKKQEKTEYIKQMDTTRGLINRYRYNEALYIDQSFCDKIEEKYVYKLEEYIGMECLGRKELYKDREITAEIPVVSSEIEHESR